MPRYHKTCESDILNNAVVTKLKLCGTHIKLHIVNGGGERAAAAEALPLLFCPCVIFASFLRPSVRPAARSLRPRAAATALQTSPNSRQFRLKNATFEDGSLFASVDGTRQHLWGGRVSQMESTALGKSQVPSSESVDWPI